MMIANLFGPSDEQAMWRVQMHDDTEAFASLLSRWEEPVKRLCLRMLGDIHKAEDMTQEAFARIYTRRKEFQHGSKFSTFLWRVATNLCLDELRRIKRRREITPSSAAVTDDSGEFQIWDHLASDEHTPDSNVALDDQAGLVRRAVTELPEHYRTVVILRHYQDLKFREIADVLGIPEGTVKSRMAEALAMLNRSLTRTIHPISGPQPNSTRPTEAFVL